MVGAVGLSIFLARPALAQWAPACTAGTLQDYLSLGSAGCSVGNVTFSNFGQVGWAFDAFAGLYSTRTPIPLSAFDVRPTTAPGGYVGLTITAPFLSGSVACPCFPSGNMTGVSYFLMGGYLATARQGYRLNYFTTQNRGQRTVSGAGAGNFASAVTQSVLYSGNPQTDPSSPIVVDAVNDVTPPYQGATYLPVAGHVTNPYAQVFSFDLATAFYTTASGNGAASVTGFEADFLVSTATVTPEPGSLSLLVLGLSGVTATVSRRRKRRGPSARRPTSADPDCVPDSPR